MKIVIFLILGLAVFASGAPVTTEHGKNFVCYYTNWSQYRPGIGKFKDANQIDPFLCTHIVYSFIEMDSGHQLKLREWNGDQLIADLLTLKQSNPDLKITAAVGGWNFGSEPFTAACASESSMNSFVSGAISFLREYGFDGLDMDWEYPGSRGSPPEDKQRFTTLLNKLYAGFENEASTTGNTRLLLTAAVAAGQPTIDAGYEIEQVCETLDLVHLMAYDLHGAWQEIVDHNAPLHATGATYASDEDQRNFYVDYAVNYWIDGGCPKEKLVLGIPTYGRGYTLTNPAESDYGDASSEAATAGTYTREAGFLSYYEICGMTGTRAVKENVDAPHLVSGDQWIGYDDETSVREKVKYLKSFGLAGAMIWAIDLDDFMGTCEGKKFLLSRAIRDELHDGAVDDNRCYPMATTTAVTWWPPAVPPTSPPVQYECFYDDVTCDCSDASTHAPQTTPGNVVSTDSGNDGSTTTTTTATTTTTSTSANSEDCPSGDGYYDDPNSCECYFRCNHGTRTKTCCANGLYWDQAGLKCEWAANVDCNMDDNNAAATTESTTTATTESATSEFTCQGKADGNYADPNDNTIFHQCSGESDTVAHCASGLVYNGNICTWP